MLLLVAVARRARSPRAASATGIARAASRRSSAQIAGQACDGPARAHGADGAALSGRLDALDAARQRIGRRDRGPRRSRPRPRIDRGDLDAARDLIERLELYRELIEAGPRGALVGDLVAPTRRRLRRRSSSRARSRSDDGANNRRYFQLPPEPGQGILVMDLFIPGESAGPLKGDGRGFANPLRDPALER